MSTKETANGKFFMGNRANGFEIQHNPFTAELEKKKTEDAAKEARELYLELEKSKQQEIDAKLETLELLPIGNKVILLPYPQNPYRKVLEGHIIVDFDGSFTNPDSGEKDKLKELVGCAKVIEVGPEVKWTQAGDDVYYDTRTVYPMPFMSMGYVETSEPSLLAIMNEGLKERFKK